MPEVIPPPISSFERKVTLKIIFVLLAVLLFLLCRPLMMKWIDPVQYNILEDRREAYDYYSSLPTQ